MVSRRDFFSRLQRGGAGALALGVSASSASGPGGVPSGAADDPALRRLLASPIEGLGPDLIPRSVKRLSGVEELRGLTSATKVGWVWLDYHTAPGDGGGGPVLIDPRDNRSQDNHGTIFRSRAGDVWKRPSLLDVTAAQFGAQGLLNSDDSLAIQRACDAVCPILGQDDFQAGRVWLGIPRVGYLIKSTLNLTNTRAMGTRGRDGFTLEGAGHSSTRLVGATGDGRAVIETTGAQWLTLRNLRIEAHTQNGSTVGVYQGIGRALPETQNQKLERLFIDLPDDAQANRRFGTIGILNFGAEENSYECCYITANSPAIFTAEDIGYQHSYVEQLSSHSLGMTTFIGESFLVSRNARWPSLQTQDVGQFHAPSLFMANLGKGGTNKCAWQIRGGFIGGTVGGIIEGHSTAFQAYGRLENASVSFVFGGIADVTAERFVLEAVSEGMVWESSLKFWDQEVPDRPLMACHPTSLAQRVPCFIRNTDIRCGADKSHLVIQENVLGNPQTGNVSIEGVRDSLSPWRWDVGDHRQELDIPPTRCQAAAGTADAELCRVVLPTMDKAGGNELSATVAISGLLSLGSEAPAQYVEQVFCLDVSDKGVTGVRAAEPSGMARPHQAESPAQGSGLISARVVGDMSTGMSISLLAHPLTAGADPRAATFAGRAKLHWFGNGSRAPRLWCET